MPGNEIIPHHALKKFDLICLHEKSLRENKELQQKLIDWAQDMLTLSREEWSETHAFTLDSVIAYHQKEKAHKGALERDRKYCEFRKTFAALQKERYLSALEKGSTLTANSFVEWFLKNKAHEIHIPYVAQNQRNKLRQLAQENNRGFKKLLLG